MNAPTQRERVGQCVCVCVCTFVVDPGRVAVGLGVLVQCLDIVGLVDGGEFGHGVGCAERSVQRASGRGGSVRIKMRRTEKGLDRVEV